MECEVCSKLQSELRRESSIETRAILHQWLRSTGGSRDREESDTDVQTTISASRKRQMQIASSLRRHKDEEHSEALVEMVHA